MARKGLSGQLNMFDFFRELEASSPQAGELEMVSLMPEEEPEIEEVLPVEEEPEAEEVLPVEEEQEEEILPVEEEQEEEILPVEEKKPEVEVILPEEVSVVENIIPIEEKKEPTLQHKKKQKDTLDLRPTMHRTYQTTKGVIEIAYINYNKVRIAEPGKEPQLTEFESSKDAVNFYVDEMQRLEELYGDEESE